MTAYDWPREIRSITRQPILDMSRRAHAYELLIDVGPNRPAGASGSDATRRIIDDLVLYGFERLTAGMPTFIQCTPRALEDEQFTLVPSSKLVLEVPHYLAATPKILESCRRLKKAGFRLALKDFVWGMDLTDFLNEVDYVKADFARRDAAGHEWLRMRLKGSRIPLVAENVHSSETFLLARGEGFSFFQGYYFCDPERLHNAKLPANRILHVEILRQLFREPLDWYAICPLVKRDPALVYRTLRLVNSPVYALREEVDSIESAILVLGETMFRRIATLAIQCEVNTDQPPEILHTALVRAKFCELAASCVSGLDSNEQYLLGMLSLLPAMLRVPMRAIVNELPLRPAIKKALLGEPTRVRGLLSWIESLERGDLSACCEIAQPYGFTHEELNRCYLEAVAWEAVELGRVD